MIEVNGAQEGEEEQELKQEKEEDEQQMDSATQIPIRRVQRSQTRKMTMGTQMNSGILGLIYSDHKFERKMTVMPEQSGSFNQSSNANIQDDSSKPNFTRSLKRKKTMVEIVEEEKDDRLNQLCPLCSLDFVSMGQVGKKLPGSPGVYHEECLKIWLTRKQSCPETLCQIEALEGEDQNALRKVDLTSKALNLNDLSDIDEEEVADNNQAPQQQAQESQNSNQGSGGKVVLKLPMHMRNIANIDRKMKRYLSKVTIKRNNDAPFQRVSNETDSISMSSHMSGLISPDKSMYNSRVSFNKVKLEDEDNFRINSIQVAPSRGNTPSPGFDLANKLALIEGSTALQSPSQRQSSMISIGNISSGLLDESKNDQSPKKQFKRMQTMNNLHARLGSSSPLKQPKQSLFNPHSQNNMDERKQAFAAKKGKTYGEMPQIVERTQAFRKKQPKNGLLGRIKEIELEQDNELDKESVKQIDKVFGVNNKPVKFNIRKNSIENNMSMDGENIQNEAQRVMFASPQNKKSKFDLVKTKEVTMSDGLKKNMALSRRKASRDDQPQVNQFMPETKENVFSFKLKAVKQDLSTPVNKESNLKVNQNLNLDLSSHKEDEYSFDI